MEPKEDTGVAYDLFNMLLVVLIAYQENVDAEKTLDRLRELSEKREGNEEIALRYAKGLFNLSCDQGEEKAEKTLDRLKELSSGNPTRSSASFAHFSHSSGGSP